MKKTISTGIMGALLAMGISRASASTNLWDQPVAFTLSVIEQTGENSVEAALANTKNLIALMSSQTITNPDLSVVTTPDFTKLLSPSLHRQVTIINGSNQPAVYEVKNAGTNVAQVTGFFTGTSDTNTVTYTRIIPPRTTTWSLDDVYFAAPEGSKVRFAGLRTAAFVPLRIGTNLITSGILVGATNTVGFAGVINGKTSEFNTATNQPIAGRGTIVVGAGHLE